MITTPEAICTRALRLIGVVGRGQTPSGTQMVDAFQTLQEMIDGWRVDRLTVLAVERAVFTLIVGQQTYTIGTGGNFNRARPVWLSQASIISNTNVSQPLELPIQVMTVGEWQQVPIKNVTSALPLSLYYDNAYSAGLGNISFWPIPSIGGLTCALYCPTALAQFDTLSTQYDLPPAYLRAIRYNLGMELASEFYVPVSPLVAQRAAESLGDIRRANIHPVVIQTDEALQRRGDLFNWYTGEPL